jgi:hypothetical protein
MMKTKPADYSFSSCSFAKDCSVWQDRQCTYEHYTESHLWDRCCHGKAISIIFYECVSVASVILHILYMYHIRSVASLAAPHFTALSHKQYDLQRKCIGHKIYFGLNISYSKTNWVRYYYLSYMYIYRSVFM